MMVAVLDLSRAYKRLVAARHLLFKLSYLHSLTTGGRSHAFTISKVINYYTIPVFLV